MYFQECHKYIIDTKFDKRKPKRHINVAMYVFLWTFNNQEIFMLNCQIRKNAFMNINLLTSLIARMLVMLPVGFVWISAELPQRALDVEITSKFSLEQRNDLLSTRFRRCSIVQCPFGLYVFLLAYGALYFLLKVEQLLRIKYWYVIEFFLFTCL